MESSQVSSTSIPQDKEKRCKCKYDAERVAAVVHDLVWSKDEDELHNVTNAIKLSIELYAALEVTSWSCPYFDDSDSESSS